MSKEYKDGQFVAGKGCFSGYLCLNCGKKQGNSSTKRRGVFYQR